MVGEQELDSDSMVLLGVVVSRPEALVIASMLEAGGIDVWIGAEHLGSLGWLQLNSVALGGYRLMVPASQWSAASELVREVGLVDSPVAFRGGRAAVVRALAAVLGPAMILGFAGMVLASLPAVVLFLIPIQYGLIPVDPRGRPDWFLTEN